MSTISPQLAASSIQRRAFVVRAEIAIAVAIALVFGQVARFHFVSWDDGPMVAENPYLHPTTLAGLKFLWAHPYYGLYIPLTYSAYAAIDLVAGAGTSGAGMFHLASLALHIASAIVVYRLALSIGAPRSGAVLGALVFAVHPLQVEPVAWIGSFDTQLSTVFTMLCLARFACLCRRAPEEARSGKIDYTLATLWFVCALLSKPTAVAIPLMSLALGWGFYRARLKRIAIEIAPWFAIAAVWALVTRAAQPFAAGSEPSVWLRPLVAGDALAFYLAKLFLPIRLAPDYARSPAWVLSHAWGYATWLFPAACALAAWRLRRAAPWLPTCLALFAAALAPVLGLVPFAYQQHSTVADRYASAAMVAPAVAVAFAFAAPGMQARRALNAAVGVIVVLCALSMAQAQQWRSSLALFTYGAAVSPLSSIMHYNLGTTLERLGETGSAMQHYRLAIALDPGYAEAHCNLASVLDGQGDTADAAIEYRAAIAAKPDLAEAHYGLGVALAEQGDTLGAAGEWQTTVRLWPDYAPARHNLAVALARLGEHRPASRGGR